MRLSNDPFSRLARALFCLTIVIVWCSAPQRSAEADSNAPGPAPAPSHEQLVQRYNQMADDLTKLVKAFSAIDGDLPRDTFDLNGVIHANGAEPDRIFAWVRDKTAYVPYRGALRGPVGVLMDRSGNSMDRSLLLAKLLQLAGQQVRLAHGKLPDDTAESLLKKVWDAPASIPPAADEITDAAVSQAASKYGLDPAETVSNVAQLQLNNDKATENLVATVMDQSAKLQSLLGPVAPDDKAQRASIRDALADHWWVQYSKSGTWIDLDCLAPDAKPADHLCAAGQTIDLPAAWDGLPTDASMMHEVEVRVITERCQGMNANTSVVLRQAVRPAALAGQTVQLMIMPIDWPVDLDITAPDPQARLKTALLAQKRWVPILSVAGQQIVQSGFDSHGVIDPKPPLDALGKAGAGFSNKLSGVVFGNQPPAVAEPTGQLTGVWLEFEIRVPGEKPRTIRRDLFDAFGPAVRAAGNLAEPAPDQSMQLARSVRLNQSIDLLPIGFMPSTEFLMHVAFANFNQNAPLLIKVLREAAGGQATLGQSFKDLSNVKPLASSLYFLAGARRGPAKLAPAFAIDRPNLFAHYEGYGLGPNDTVTYRAAIDILDNTGTIRGLAGGDAFKARLTRGVMETALERTAMHRETGGLNTATLLAASTAQRVDWVKLATPDDPNFSRLTLKGDVKERIRGDLRAGYIVLAPVASISSGGQNREGWWRIDPRDGSTIGFSEDGRGTEVAELMVIFLSILYAEYHAFKCIEEGGSALGCSVCFCLSAAVDILSAGIAEDVEAPANIASDVAVGTAVGAAVGHSVCDTYVTGGGGE
jgi:hypothetical protein